MKTAVHQYEDKLLEFAYGELPASEADAVDAHVRQCPRCSESLAHLRSVRGTMSQLKFEAVPEAGLDSLLAYAQTQAARNAEAVAVPWYRKLGRGGWVTSLASVSALLVVGVVAFRASENYDVNPAMVAVKADEDRELARKGAPSPVAPASVAQVAPPAPPQPDTAPGEGSAASNALGYAEAEGGEQAAQPGQAKVALAENYLDGKPPTPKQVGYDKAKKGGAKLDPQVAEKKQASDDFDSSFGTGGSPKKANKLTSETRRKAVANDPKVTGGLEQDYSNAAQRGALYKERVDAPEPVATKEAPKEAPAKGPEGKSWGLGTPSPSTSGADLKTGAGDGLNDRLVAAPKDATGSLGSASTTVAKPVVVAKREAPAAKDPYRAEEEAKKNAPVAAAAPSPAPPVPSAEPAPAPVTPSSNEAYAGKKQKLSKKSLEFSKAAPSTETAAASDDESPSSVKADSVSPKQASELRQMNLEAARVSSQRNDRVSEIKFALSVLSAGATGAERLESLKRVCDAYEAIGEYDRADPYCDLVVSEYPRSAAADAISKRRNSSQRARSQEVQAEKAPAPAPSPAKPTSKPSPKAADSLK